MTEPYQLANIIQRSHIIYRDPAGMPERDNDPWTRLSLYQSVDLLDERFKERHGIAPKDAKCREIASHLTQGSQYFLSARNAGDLARPLLLYYGVLSLTRAMILFADRSARETTLSNAHGLSAHQWSNILVGDKSGSRIPQLLLQFHEGTFLELARTTSNAEWTQLAWRSDTARLGLSNGLSGAIGWLAGGTGSLQKTQTVTLGEVIKRIPDLALLYEETIGELAACFPAGITLFRGPFNMGPAIPPKDREVQIVIWRNRLELPDDASLITLLGLDSSRFQPMRRDALGRPHLNAELEEGTSGFQVLPPIRVNRHWADYAVAPLPDGEILSTMSLLFLIAYSTGMLVRYYPTVWQDMTSIRSGDRAFPLLRAAVSHIELRFPIEVADFFERNIPVGKASELPLSSN